MFNYYVDEATCMMVPWEDKVPGFQYFPDDFSNLFVPTVETTRLTYFLDSLVNNKHYVMFVGNTGTVFSPSRTPTVISNWQTLRQLSAQ